MIHKLIESLRFACLLTLTSVAWAVPLVVETDPLTPEEQRVRFHLPPGFEIQLVVSETDIGQPMNLNFDAAGRLWVTHSVEYPYPVAGAGVQPRDGQFQGLGQAPARDRLTVLSGIGADGKPQSIVHFATGLNIPIGVVPVAANRGAAAARATTIAFTIPNITQFADTNGDGQSDQQQVLYGPFGNLDTHGMTNSFTRWLDGWIYACHGFRNTSTVHGTDGHEFTMNSGNTFRFREDGSRIEQYSWGQVNPFGLAFDRWGNIYNADCHSMPLTCILQGAYYQSFGKPHDGLGFGPDMLDHNHGSTGICGVAWYEAPQFPEEYQDCIYLCNPVNGQVHRDRIPFRGSSPWVETQPDFITCDDGWFRPVDVKLGPDGALYIADFYNAIIGHYEVPLDHPRRDRTHGRIWRVIYRGESNSAAVSALPDLSHMTSSEVVNLLNSPNITVRTLATNELVDRSHAAEIITTLQAMLRTAGTPGNDRGQVHAMWALARLGGLEQALLQELAASPSALVRTHVCHILREQPQYGSLAVQQLPKLLRDQHPLVQRAAAQAAAQRPTVETLEPLLTLLSVLTSNPQGDTPGDTPCDTPGDTHLLHVTKIAVRNHLSNTSEDVASTVWPAFQELATNSPMLATEIALGSEHAPGARLAMELISRSAANGSPERLPDLLRHIARYAQPTDLQPFVAQRAASLMLTTAQQFIELEALRTGLAERGLNPGEILATWGTALTLKLLQQTEWVGLDWTSLPLPGEALQAATFVTQQRASADGDTLGVFYCSLPAGEQMTGMLRSDSFAMPAELSFYIAGHNAVPGNEQKGTNLVRLRAHKSGEILAETLPPRNDIAQRITWDLAAHAGQPGYLEIVDGDTGSAYAWLAVGRFSLLALNPGAASPAKQAAGLIAALKLTELEPQLVGLVTESTIADSTRLQAADAYLTLHPNGQKQALLFTARFSLAAELRERCLQATVMEFDPALDEVLALSMQSASQQEQVRLANLLVADSAGGEALLRLVSQGKASAQLLTRVDLVERLKSLNLSGLEERLADLTRNLPPANEQVAALIEQRRSAIEQLAVSEPQAGLALFKKHCAACHQFKGEGNKIGPQLDGVANRGVDRLLEDILDPNRNIDAAFRTSTLAMTSGQVLTGLKRRAEGATLVFANNEGKEFTVNSADIEEQRESPLSLMPANIAEQISAQDFAQLVRFLLTQ